MAETSTTTIHVEGKTVLKVVGTLLLLWGLYHITNILLLLVASVFLAAAIEPWVDRLQKKHIPRVVSMIGIYIILFTVVGGALVAIFPIIVQQIAAIAQNFPALYQHALESIANYANITTPIDSSLALPIPNAVSLATQQVLNVVVNIFGGIISFITVMVMTFYLVVDEGAIRRTLAIARKQDQAYLANLYERLQKRIGIWLRAQLLLMVAVGLMTFIMLNALSLFGFRMPYILLLSIIAGLGEVIPYVGPIIGALPAIFLAYTISPSLALVVALAYYIIQLTENNVLTPKIMERALGVSPIISIVAFLIGAQLAGIAGAFLAIPIVTALAVILKDIYGSDMSHAMESSDT